MEEKRKYNISKPQKLKTISFQEWCKQNDRQDLMDRWDYELNKYTPDAVACKSGYKIFFKCPNGKHKSKSVVLASVTIGGNKIECNECKLERDSFGRWCEDNAPELLDLWDYELNKLSPYEVTRCSNTQYYFKCPTGTHVSLLHDLSHITQRDYKIYCKYCNSFAQYLLDNFGDDALTLLWDSDKNDTSPYDITRSSSRKKVWIRCLENSNHGSYLISPDNFSKGRRCPICKQENQNSKLARKVNKYIEDNYNYQLLHEYQCTVVCKNPENGYVLPYDNQLVIDNYNLFIEVHGIQHYKATGFLKKDMDRYNISLEDALLRRQQIDKYKEDYIKSLDDCYYLAIPYWTEKDDSYKTLIDDKIQQILNNTKLI